MLCLLTGLGTTQLARKLYRALPRCTKHLDLWEKVMPQLLVLLLHVSAIALFCKTGRTELTSVTEAL